MNVLLVDDQPRILAATQKLVNWEKLGVGAVFTAESAEEAKAILRTTPIDIMLTDIEMPGEDGIALQRWQNREYPEIVSIFLTSHAEFGYAQEAIRNGAADYILQPAAIPDIEAVLQRCITRLAERRNLVELSRNINDTLTKSLNSGMEWSRWILRGDTPLVRSQIEKLLDAAQAEGKLTTGHLRRVHHAFMEACAIVCYTRKKDLRDLLNAGEITYEAAARAHDTQDNLMRVVDYCLEKLVGEEDGQGEAPLDSPEKRIRELLRYLNENLDKMISRREAANYVFLNEDYFSRAFRRETGMGYKEYVLKQKMEYAARLLADTDLPVTLVASKVGYDNYNNFTQMFRKIMSVTPTEYRKQRRSGEEA